MNYFIGLTENSVRFDRNGNRISHWRLLDPGGLQVADSGARRTQRGYSRAHAMEKASAAEWLNLDRDQMQCVSIVDYDQGEATVTLYCAPRDAKKAVNDYFGRKVQRLDEYRRATLEQREQ